MMKIDVRGAAKAAHDGLGAVVAYVAPLLAPLPSAMAIYAATGNVVVAVVFESLGFAAVAVALRTYRHNQRAEPGDRFPLWLPVGMFLVYFVTTMMIIIAAETLPAWAQWRHGDLPVWEFVASIGPALYPLLTTVGAGVYALFDNLDAFQEEMAVKERYVQAEADLSLERMRRELDFELEQKRADREARREAKRLRLEAKLDRNAVQIGPLDQESGTATSGGPADRNEKMERIETVIGTDPFASLGIISQETGIPKTTVNRLLKGAGYHKNGQGWEVIGG